MLGQIIIMLDAGKCGDTISFKENVLSHLNSSQTLLGSLQKYKGSDSAGVRIILTL